MANTNSIQLSLLGHNQQSHYKEIFITNDKSQWGTFKDSLKAPVHRWFTYPAGFSFRAVEYSFQKFQILEGMKVYDPFMGSGTTNLVAKSCGINSVGVEAHPFVFDIAKTKLNWEVDRNIINAFIGNLQGNFDKLFVDIEQSSDFYLSTHFPELVIKCYPTKTLIKLLVIKDFFN